MMTKEESVYVEEMYREHFKSVFLYARSILHRDDLAQEAAQQTFSICCNKPQDLMDADSQIAWLYGICKRVCIASLRKSKKMAHAITKYEAGFSVRKKNYPSAESVLDLKTLYGDSISDDEFHLIEECILNRRTIISVAKELDISVAACQKRIKRALKKLEKYS